MLTATETTKIMKRWY